MRKLIIASVSLSLLFLWACSAPATYDTAAITSAVEQALNADGGTIALSEVQIEETAGDFVRALAIPEDTSAYESAYVFLKRNGANWDVLNYGTAFDIESYQQDGIPEELWLGTE